MILETGDPQAVKFHRNEVKFAGESGDMMNFHIKFAGVEISLPLSGGEVDQRRKRAGTAKRFDFDENDM